MDTCKNCGKPLENRTRSFARPAAPWKTQRRGPGGRKKPGMRAAGA